MSNETNNVNNDETTSSATEEEKITILASFLDALASAKNGIVDAGKWIFAFDVSEDGKKSFAFKRKGGEIVQYVCDKGKSIKEWAAEILSKGWDKIKGAWEAIKSFLSGLNPFKKDPTEEALKTS